MTSPADSRPRSILPDGMDDTRLVIIKACSSLRLTNEIRLASRAAQRKQLAFILAVPPSCVLEPQLLGFVEDHGITVYRTE